jgi:flagella basal body P-ring formation protein FlgA
MRIRLNLVALGLAALTAIHGHAMVIHLNPTAVVDGSGVRFGDLVSSGQSVPAGWDARRVADVASTATVWTLQLGDVARMLHQYTDMHHVVLLGNPEIQITVRVETFAFDRLDAAISAYLGSSEEYKDRRFMMCRRTGVLPLLPSGEEWQPAVSRLQQTGSAMTAHVAFTSRTGRTWDGGEIEIPLVEVFPYWQSARPLLRGGVLSERDVEVRWLSRADGTRYYPASESIVGMELRRNMPSGQMLVLGALVPPVYARRGEVVRVQVQHGGMTVTLRARALADGRRDERIPCLNERSGKRLYVRMVSPREAILEGGSES